LYFDDFLITKAAGTAQSLSARLGGVTAAHSGRAKKAPTGYAADSMCVIIAKTTVKA
jgi:hypothetical protein